MKKTFFLILSFIVVIILFPAQLMAQPVVSAEAAILMDLGSGQILYQKNKDKLMYPASTTKIMTTLIAIKKGNLNDLVKVSRQACLTDGSSVGLQEGEVIRLEDLLYTVMLASDNQGAMAVAEHIGGSVENFARLMNDEAKAMGAVNTHFANPHGLHDPNHYTTAGDLAIIAREAMKNSVFRKYAGSYDYHFKRNMPRPVNGIPQEDFVNLNRLLWEGYAYGYKGATGVKTGYTDEARRCLVSSAQRDGRELLAVVMKTENLGIYTDSITLLDYGFNQFKQVNLAQQGAEAGRVKVQNGVIGEIGAVTAGAFGYSLPVSDQAGVQSKLNLYPNLEAPLKKGQRVGSLSFIKDGKEIGSVGLVADRDVDRQPFFRWWYGAVIIGLLYIYASARVRARRRRYYLERRRRYY